MDPILKSTITSVAAYGLGAAGAWAVAQGYITKDQASTLTADIIGGGSVLIGGLLVWYKARQHTAAAQIAAVPQAAMIQTLNADQTNGVKVVADNARSAPLEAVSAPQPPVNK